MAKFRKKPIVVEATVWDKHGDHAAVHRYAAQGQAFNAKEMSDALVAPCDHCTVPLMHHGWIPKEAGLEGGHIVCPGDWVITGTAGEYYSCKPDIFVDIYDPE